MSALKEGGFNVAEIQTPDFGLDKKEHKKDIDPLVAAAMAEKQKRMQVGTAQNK